MNKKEIIRKKVLTRRNNITAQERLRRSSELCHKLDSLLTLALSEKTREIFVAFYAAFGSEVELTPCINAAYQHRWRICFPCMETPLPAECSPATRAHKHMVFREVSYAQYATHKDIPFILHPAQTFSPHDSDVRPFPSLSSEKLDAVIVPLVAFDKHANRLGYGGGNYDRLLARLNPHTLVIGVAFAEQEVPSLPAEHHDQPLPYLLIA